MDTRPHIASAAVLAGSALALVVACTAAPTSAPPAPTGATPAASASSPAASASSSAPSGWRPITDITDQVLPAGRLGMTANGRPDAP